jgi:hypothetical protein
VNCILYSSISLPFALFHTDTHTTPPLQKPNSRQRGRTSRQCFMQEQGEPHSLIIVLIHICTLYIETHRTPSWMESNPRWRSKTSRLCFRKQQGEVHFINSSMPLPSLLFHIETHQTRPWWKSNRRERGRWSRQCFKRQHSETHSITLICHIVMCTFFTQQLIQLDLSGNAIGDEGANYLANILENNEVNRILYWLLSLASALFHTGTHRWRP